MAFDWKGAFTGTGGGAATGAAAGSFFPGVGTAVGAGLGAGLGFLGGGLGGGREQQIKQYPLTPEQQAAYSQLIGQGQNKLQNPYQGFDAIANRANSFYNQTVSPGLAENFTGLTNGALSSGALGLQGQQARIDLAERLAALQSQYGMQNQQSALKMLQLGLSPSQNQYELPAEGGFGNDLLQSGMGMLPLIGQNQQSRNLESILGDIRQRQYNEEQEKQRYKQAQGGLTNYKQGYFQQQNPFMGQGGNFRVNPSFLGGQ